MEAFQKKPRNSETSCLRMLLPAADFTLPEAEVYATSSDLSTDGNWLMVFLWPKTNQDSLAMLAKKMAEKEIIWLAFPQQSAYNTVS